MSKSKHTISSAFESRKMGDVLLKNCFIKSATYEGMYEKGLPTQKLIDHHTGLAKGEGALTTVSYGAVSNSGRRL